MFFVWFFLTLQAYAGKRIAVLEFRGFNIESNILEQVTDYCRNGVRDGLNPDDFEVFSRINTQILLQDNGIDIQECDSQCEVTLGRQMGVDFIVTGNVTIIENTYVLSMKLHDTLSGSLLATTDLMDPSLIQILSKAKESSQSMVEEHVAQSMVESENTVRTTFRTNVPGVRIWYNGLICTTDDSKVCTGNAPKGKHKIEFQKDDYSTVKKTVQISKVNTEVSVDLKSKFAYVTLNLIPSTLELTVNGEPTKALYNTKLKPGVYEIMASGPCHLNQGIRASFIADETYNPSLVVETKRTGIDIEAYDKAGNAIEADVFIESRFMGVTPLQRSIDLCGKNGEVKQVITVKYQGKSKSLEKTFQQNKTESIRIDF